jgi:hypothetical protein
MEFLQPSKFETSMTSRTIKNSALTREEIQEGIDKGKFDRIDTKQPLPHNTHGVNVFCVPEMKGRRRIITEPLLNACFEKGDMPKCIYPSRLERRQRIRKAKYLYQIDFEAFYDAIPIPEELKQYFVFRCGTEFFCLRTLPTGARWSVAVAQAITWAICDIDLPPNVRIETMIDNILIAGEEGSEKHFVQVIRTLTRRMKHCNCQTDPSTDAMDSLTDDKLLQQSMQDNTFLGETFVWNGRERLVRNGVKTIAKIELATAQNKFTYRTLASLIALILYAMHTVHINPAEAFFMLRMYRGIAVAVSKNGGDWDMIVPFISEKGWEEIQGLAQRLVKNDLTQIPLPHNVTYREEDYDEIFFVDASANGWAAIRVSNCRDKMVIYQQMWIHTLTNQLVKRETKETVSQDEQHNVTFRHSAHAEPWAIRTMLQHILRVEKDFGSKRIAIVTDHFAIPQAQRKQNNFGGIGRGFALNSLYQVANNIPGCWFFYIEGLLNPADTFSRNFPPEMKLGKILITEGTPSVPLLNQTFSPLCEPAEKQLEWMR